MMLIFAYTSLHPGLYLADRTSQQASDSPLWPRRNRGILTAVGILVRQCF